MQKHREHNYVLGFTIKTMQACTNYVRPQQKTFRKLVFDTFFNWFPEENIPEGIFNV